MIAECKEDEARAKLYAPIVQCGMRCSLKPHADSRPPANISIDADVRSIAGRLTVRFVVTGPMDEVRIPPRALPMRADELWRHTCFEVFLKSGASEGYTEFNFSPSMEWAAYEFEGYRKGMRSLAIPTPTIVVRNESTQIELSAEVDLSQLPIASTIAVSTVLEDLRGTLSYWALAHPSGKPDFHHAQGFKGFSDVSL